MWLGVGDPDISMVRNGPVNFGSPHNIFSGVTYQNLLSYLENHLGFSLVVILGHALPVFLIFCWPSLFIIVRL